MAPVTASVTIRRVSRTMAAPVISGLLLVAILWSVGPRELLRNLLDFPLWSLSGMLILLAVNLAVVSLRLWRMLSRFGVAIPWRAVSRASIAGHVAALWVISLFGQALGRQAILRAHGVSPALGAALSAYERAVMALLGCALAVAGAGALLGWDLVNDFLAHLPIIEVAVAVVGGVALSLWLGRSRFEKKLTDRFNLRAAMSRLVEMSVITMAGQLLMFSVYVVAILAIRPELNPWLMFAAAAVISFAASMPISVNGWGVRELAAVYVLGALGIPQAQALSVSVVVGLCSTVAILVAAPIALRGSSLRHTNAPNSVSARVSEKGDLEKAAAWLLASATALFVFFQFHVRLSEAGGDANLNLADPFALLALAAVVMNSLSEHRLPAWRARGFNAALIAMSVLLVFAFLRGVADIGITQWALGGRLLGWLVLLGYVSAGYLIVHHAGAHGLRRFSETLVATGAVVVLLQVGLRLLAAMGINLGAHLAPNFEGYASNRNAFAFQLLICLAILLSYSVVVARHADVTGQEWNLRARSRATLLLFGIILLGLLLSASRTGLITGGLMLLVAWTLRLADRRLLVRGFMAAAVLWAVVAWLPGLLGAPSVQSAFSGELSNMERWETVTRGLGLWRQFPVLGAGLGVFIEHSTAWFDGPQVIHSTPVWVLAEFGLLGAVVFGGAFMALLRATQIFSGLSAHRMLLLFLLCFAVFGLVHEIFYQRIFWLVLGAALAYPGGRIVGNHVSA